MNPIGYQTCNVVPFNCENVTLSLYQQNTENRLTFKYYVLIFIKCNLFRHHIINIGYGIWCTLHFKCDNIEYMAERVALSEIHHQKKIFSKSKLRFVNFFYKIFLFFKSHSQPLFIYSIPKDNQIPVSRKAKKTAHPTQIRIIK